MGTPEEQPQAPSGAEHRLQTPMEVAHGAVDRLCAYDAVAHPGDWQTTALRAATFLHEFTLVLSQRMAQVAQRSGRESDRTEERGREIHEAVEGQAPRSADELSVVLPSPGFLGPAPPGEVASHAERRGRRTAHHNPEISVVLARARTELYTGSGEGRDGFWRGLLFELEEIRRDNPPPQVFACPR